MSKCKLCKEKLMGGTMNSSKGTLCMKCYGIMALAHYQPMASMDSVFWILAETYFRKGQGEDISFEEVWNENENLKLVKFMELWKNKK